MGEESSYMVFVISHQLQCCHQILYVLVSLESLMEYSFIERYPYENRPARLKLLSNRSSLRCKNSYQIFISFDRSTLYLFVV